MDAGSAHLSSVLCRNETLSTLEHLPNVNVKDLGTAK